MQFDVSPSTSQGSCAHHAGKISSEAKLKLFIEPVPYAATSYLGTIGTTIGKDSKMALPPVILEPRGLRQKKYGSPAPTRRYMVRDVIEML